MAAVNEILAAHLLHYSTTCVDHTLLAVNTDTCRLLCWVDQSVVRPHRYSHLSYTAAWEISACIKTSNMVNIGMTCIAKRFNIKSLIILDMLLICCSISLWFSLCLALSLFWLLYWFLSLSHSLLYHLLPL